MFNLTQRFIGLGKIIFFALDCQVGLGKISLKTNRNMKKGILMILCALAALTAGAQKHEVYIADFDKLIVVDDINVIYRCVPDSAGNLVFYGDKESADCLLIKNDTKGKLTIQVTTEAANRKDIPTLTVYSSNLISVFNEGKRGVSVNLLPKCEKFKAVLSDNGSIILNNVNAESLTLQIITGAGSITASGKTEKLDVKLVGTGNIHAEEVRADKVNCNMTGTGKVYCNLTGGELYIKGSGTGRVFYKGQPEKIKTRKMGTLKAIPLE